MIELIGGEPVAIVGIVVGHEVEENVVHAPLLKPDQAGVRQTKVECPDLILVPAFMVGQRVRKSRRCCREAALHNWVTGFRLDDGRVFQ